MFCEKCGNEVDEHAKYCHKCGARIISNQNTSKKEIKFKNKKIMICILVLVIIAGAIFLNYHDTKIDGFALGEIRYDEHNIACQLQQKGTTFTVSAFLKDGATLLSDEYVNVTIKDASMNIVDNFAVKGDGGDKRVIKDKPVGHYYIDFNYNGHFPFYKPSSSVVEFDVISSQEFDQEEAKIRAEQRQTLVDYFNKYPTRDL